MNHAGAVVALISLALFPLYAGLAVSSSPIEAPCFDGCSSGAVLRDEMCVHRG